MVVMPSAVGGPAPRGVWRRVSAGFGMNRCYLYPGGLVVTNLFGQHN